MKASPIPILALFGAGLVAGCVVYVPQPSGGAPPPQAAAEAPVDDTAPDTPVTPSAEVDFGVFYSDLTPYGEWVDRPGYGRVWLPSGRPAGWRPYTLGRWVETDYGWTWVSE